MPLTATPNVPRPPSPHPIRILHAACRPLAWLLLGLSAHAAAAGQCDGPPRPLKFADFFERPIGPRGLELGAALRDADQRCVRLVGYMVVQEQATPGRFLLTARPVRMSEHADGEADDLPPAHVMVLLDPAQSERRVAAEPGPVALTGQLQVGRVEHADGRVSWVRLQLDPEALAAQHAAARTSTPLPVTP